MNPPRSGSDGPRLTRIVLWSVLLSSVHYAPIVNGQLPAAPYPYPQSASDRLVGQYNITIADFHLAPVGTVKTFYGGDECNQLWLTITVGSSFWSAKVQNAFFCDCFPFAVCQPPFQAWRFRSLNSFLISFVDVSTSAYYRLPTRHNSPDDGGASPTVLNVPSAVDRLQTTARVIASLTFRRRDRISYYTPEASPSIECNADYMLGGTHQTYDQRNFLWRTLGLRVRRYGVNQTANMFWMKRKRPFPPYEFYVWNRCCNGGYYYYSCSVTVWANFASNAMSSTEFESPWLSAPCCYVSSGSICGCQGHSLELHFYETTRYYSASYKHSDITNPSETVVTGLVNISNAAIYTPPDAIHTIRFRFLNVGIAYNSTFALLTTNPAARYRRAMYILQPFPIADLWVQITDEYGGIIFQEQETHVPYVDPEDEGQVGWLWAIEHMYNRSSKSANVVVKYNRRAKVGNTQEETRAQLLMRWLLDNGAQTSSIISPIPSSILIQPQLLGAVAANAVPQFGTVGTVPADCILHQNYSAVFYNYTLLPFVNLVPRCRQLVSNFSASVDPFEQRDFLNALFVTLRGVNPLDNTSSWFVFYDTFYPKRPTALPVFFDPALLSTLLGFSEIPRLVQQSLDAWVNEYNTLQACFPWWQQEVTLFRWQNTRAWVKSLTYVFFATNEVVLLPGPSLWRQGTVPNVAATWTGYNASFDKYEDVRLVALTNITANTELVLDYHGEQFDTVSYFLRYGNVPDAAPDGCTVPDTNLILLGTNESRATIVVAYARTFNETYLDSLNRLMNALSTKLAQLPLVVNGLGVGPSVLAAATRILDAERRIISTHLNYGWTEYWDIIAGVVLPPPF